MALSPGLSGLLDVRPLDEQLAGLVLYLRERSGLRRLVVIERESKPLIRVGMNVAGERPHPVDIPGLCVDSAFRSRIPKPLLECSVYPRTREGIAESLKGIRLGVEGVMQNARRGRGTDSILSG